MAARASCSTAITTCSRSIRSNLWTDAAVRSAHRGSRQRPQDHRRARRLRRQGPAHDLRRGLPRLQAVTGKLPLDITMMIEGEEECGSKSLFPFVKENADEFKLDMALVCDTAMWSRTTPSVTTSLRGLVYEDVTVTAADRDLHSGLFGGAAQNPIRVLNKALSAIHDDNGRITIPGFYDGVPELPADIKADLKALNLTRRGIPRPDRPENSGRREGPHADRDDLDAAGLRRQRHHRRLYRRGRQDRDPLAGEGEGVVPSGRRPESGKDPRCLPRLHPRAHPGRLQGRVREPRLRAGAAACRSTVRRS